MQKETLRTELNLQRVYQELLPTTYRVAYTYMKNSYDSEDAAQEAFIRLARCAHSFRDDRDLKAWMIVTVSNICKDMLRRRHRQDLNLDDYPELRGMYDENDANTAVFYFRNAVATFSSFTAPPETVTF